MTMASMTDALPPAAIGTRTPPAQGAPLSTLGYLAYGIGMVGERVFRDAPALLLLLFMTEYLGIPAAMAGLAVFVPKIAVIILDPLVGSYSDSLHTRWGRRRPLMFAGAILTSLALLAFFHVPHFGSAVPQAAYMALIITIGFAAYSLFSVPYLTMASEIVSSPHERAKLMSWRVTFMAVGLVVGACAGMVIEFGGGGLAGYSFMAWLFATICLVTMLTTVFSTGFARHGERDGVKMGIVAQIRLVAGNERYRLLLLVGFLQKLGEGVGYGSFAFFCIFVVKQPLSSMVIVVVSAMTAQALSQPLWLWASRYWSRPALYNVGVLGWCLNLALWLLMEGRSRWWLIPLGIQSGIAAGGFLMITLSMLSNAIADDGATTGRNQEGIYSGFWLAAEKVAFALGALIVGVLLQLFGFRESSGGVHIAQTPWAVTGIAFTYCGANMLVYLVSMIPVWRYRRFESTPDRV